MFATAKVRGHFDVQGTLDQHLGDLLEQTVLAVQVFRFLISRQQAVDQVCG